jgi:parallel beta-helix repeat protein
MRSRRHTVAMLTAGLLALTGCSSGAESPPPAAPAQPEVPWPAGLPTSDPVTCPAPTVPVSTAQQLLAALQAAGPGTVIGLADGTYAGEFTAQVSGTREAPIWLCGSAGAVLTGPDPDDGIVVHLQNVAHWRLVGFSVTNGQKGVMADGTSASVVQNLTVSQIGDEGIHLRTASTGNVVRGNTIFDTGLREVKFGEGIYVGSAVSNWGRISGGGPDRSDGNVIVDNTIRDTAAENVDIKEGTTGGVLADNTFDGEGMQGDADSWVDVKGNGWLIQGNRGAHAEANGFEVNVQADGWGQKNVFDGNTGDVGGSGYGFDLDPVGDNRVTCSNTVDNAEQGAANTPCS